jgi:hypothetical protein
VALGDTAWMLRHRTISAGFFFFVVLIACPEDWKAGCRIARWVTEHRRIVLERMFEWFLLPS